MLLPKDRVGYLDNAPKHRAKTPKHPLKGAGKGALRAFHYKAIIRKRFLVHSGLLVPTSVCIRCLEILRKFAKNGEYPLIKGLMIA